MPVSSKIDIINNENKEKDTHELSPVKVKVYKSGLDEMNYLKDGPTYILQKQVIEGMEKGQEYSNKYDMDLSHFVTALNLSQSVTGQYDTASIELKLSQSAFNRFFGDGLAQVNTGMMISIQRPAYHMSEQNEMSSILNITKDNEEIITSIKKNDVSPSDFKKDVEKDGLKDKDLIDFTSKHWLDLLSSKPSITKDEIKQNSNETVKKIQQKIQQREKELAALDTFDIHNPNKKLSYTCIFLGFITNIRKVFMTNDIGNQIVNISLSCDNFLYPFKNTEFLYMLPQLAYSYSPVETNTNEFEVQYPNANDFYPIPLPKEYDLDYLNNWVKHPDIWTAFLKSFAFQNNLQDKESSKFLNIRNLIKKIIRTFGQTLMPIGLQASIPVDKPAQRRIQDLEVIDQITGKVLNPKGWLKLGMLINVITEQQHLPKSSVFRQFLPVNSTTATALRSGFKNPFNENSVMVPWSLIYGTFVPDLSIFDCFPIMIPLDNYSELDIKINLERVKKSIDNQNIQYKGESDKYPEFNPEIEVQSIYDFYKLIGGIPCVVYRYKLLDPEFSLNENNYKRLVAEHYLAHYLYGAETFTDKHYSEENVKKWKRTNQIGKDNLAIENFNNPRLYRQLQTIYRNHDFVSPKINLMPNSGDILITKNNLELGGYKMNQDACLADKIPYLDFKDVKSFDINYDDGNKVNLLWVSNPAGSIIDGSTFDTKLRQQTIINWYNIIVHGIHMLKIQYPFADDTKDTNSQFLLALAERLYSIYNEGNKRATGTINVNMQMAPDICKGGWLRLKMNRQIEAEHFEYNEEKHKNMEGYEYALKLEEYYQKFFDFYCYVENINTSYVVDSNSGNFVITNSISFSRGKFGLIPTTWPEIISEQVRSETQATAKDIEEINNEVKPVEKAAQQAQQIDKPKDAENPKIPSQTESEVVKQWLEMEPETHTSKQPVKVKTSKSNRKEQTTKNKIKKK